GVAVVVEVDVAAGALVVDVLAVVAQVTAFGGGGARGAFGAGDIGQVGDVLGRFDRSCGFGGQRDRGHAVVDLRGELEVFQVGFELGESFVEVGVVGAGGHTGGTGDDVGVVFVDRLTEPLVVRSDERRVGKECRSMTVQYYKQDR